MDKEYFFFYTESMIVCIILFGILLGRDLIKGNRQERQFRFDNVLLAHILYFISDSFWAAIKAGVIRRTAFNVLLCNFLDMFLLSLIANTWFFYATVLADMPRRNTKRGKLLIWLPMLVSCAFVLVTMFIKPQLWINEDLEMTTQFDLLFVITPVIYVICSLIFSLYQAVQPSNRINRRFYLFLAFYPLTVVIVGIIQIIFVNAPIFCYSCTIMMMLFYIMSLEDQVSLDPLTKLNNRGELRRYVDQASAFYREGKRTFVVMADVNDFKQINDIYGHAEGDFALVTIANALRHAASRAETPPFLGRYGGDEFILIAYFDSGEDLEKMIQDIRNELESICHQEKRPYEIKVGFGYAEYHKGDDFQACLKRADENLYLDKRKMKMEGTV